jgi:hypothetical protein
VVQYFDDILRVFGLELAELGLPNVLPPPDAMGECEKVREREKRVCVGGVCVCKRNERISFHHGPEASS